MFFAVLFGVPSQLQFSDAVLATSPFHLDSVFCDLTRQGMVLSLFVGFVLVVILNLVPLGRNASFYLAGHLILVENKSQAIRWPKLHNISNSARILAKIPTVHQDNNMGYHLLPVYVPSIPRNQRVGPASNFRHCEERCAGGERAGHDCRTESCIYGWHASVGCACNGPFMHMHCSSLFYGPTWPSISNTYSDLWPLCESFQVFSTFSRPKGSETS